jgi:arylsulfatase A-like enzyme
MQKTWLVPLLPLVACAPAPPARAVRLTEVPVDLVGKETPKPRGPSLEWKFEGTKPKKLPATFGFEAGPGVAHLAVQEGHLVGDATTEMPIVHLDRTEDLSEHDVVHAIEIRARASAGTEIAVETSDSEKLDLDQQLAILKGLPSRSRTHLTPGKDFATYTFGERDLGIGTAASSMRHLMIRPTDAKGAHFEIESVKIILRGDFLASLPSGVSWQGLSGIYRESLVTRVGEKARFSLRLPARPSLDLGLGTLEGGAASFRVEIEAAGGKAVLLDRTVTTPLRWEDVALDLSPYASQDVTLSLSVASDRPGAAGLWGRPAVRSLGGGERNVILVWIDTLRRDHLSAYGYARPTTPTIAALAKEGTLFEDCLSQATWTKVATPALLTSLYPLSNTVREFNDRLPSSAVTMADVFHKAGYATLSMSSVLFTGAFSNLHKGFEEVQEDSSLPEQNSSKTARPYLDRLLPWLEAHKEAPFFVFLHVTDPHDPYRGDPPYDTLYADRTKREEHERQQNEARKTIEDPLMRLFGMPSRAELVKAKIDPDPYVAYDRDLYDGAIRGLDTEISRLVERLRALSLDGKTLVVLTGDHGEEFHEHGRSFHGQTTYGELNEIPLVLWGAGAARGRVVKETVQTIDIMPTILELCRLSPPPGIQGQSFAALLADGAPAPGAFRVRPALTEKWATNKPGNPPPLDTESYAIVEGGYKLVQNVQKHQGTNEFELYDHAKDPLDKKDVASEHKDVVLKLAKEIAAWRKTAEDARLKPDSESAKSLSPEQLERLKSLGYIQ